MPHKRLRWVSAVISVILAGVIVSVAFKFESLQSLFPSGWTWKAVSWRAQLFARKAEGDIPDLSWRELWFMAHVRGGFGLEDFVQHGSSLEGTVVNPYVTLAIFKAAASFPRTLRGLPW